MERRRLPRPLRWAIACAALCVLYAIVPVRAEPDTAVLVFRWCLTLAILAVLVFAIGKQALRQLRERDAPFGPLAVGVLAGLLFFALVDYALAVHRPDEFDGLRTRIDALYFALSTLLTVGFGDVSAQGQGARLLLCVQMAFNVTVIAGSASIITRRLVDRVRGSERHRA
jgi:energy-coupling factor transporter transmembrane protein EcfT